MDSTTLEITQSKEFAQLPYGLQELIKLSCKHKFSTLIEALVAYELPIFTGKSLEELHTDIGNIAKTWTKDANEGIIPSSILEICGYINE